ncbi:hypothetical protein [Polyangium aurulentum]|uniref:hypothetical protein n=1 Tax=Polyangium aurulentum TaxID=2567896 RepID=UPI0010AE71C4|nr:hypothetical protein [Polyangium aurulentum]UQA62562.1 hypothetical protein E8A73_019750 [Polyangium aurulentum]
MSVKPEFAFRLLTGEKRVEFRRRAAARKIDHIVVYASSPISAVVGILEISRVAQDSPRRLWQKFSEVGGIRRVDFFSYFAGVEEGYAYVVKRAWHCPRPQPLGKAGLPQKAPQAYQYLHRRTIKALLARDEHIESDYEDWLTQYRR